MALTTYEAARFLAMPVMPALYGEVRSLIKLFVPPGARVLDVGGRKSWYTIGLPISVTISDLPRTDAIQHGLGLGLTDELANSVTRHRSNVAGVVLDDMTATALPPSSYDAIVAVEVIEHVDDDQAFVANLRRTLKPGGVVILTTPNGDRNPVPRGDHRRHYRLSQLAELLSQDFEDVGVGYAVAATEARFAGLVSLDPRKPGRTARAILGNIINRRQSAHPGVRSWSEGAAHLLAVGFRPDDG